jgi:hypothetical protein
VAQRGIDWNRNKLRSIALSFVYFFFLGKLRRPSLFLTPVAAPLLPQVMRDFVSWLREHNDGARAAARAVGGGDEAAARATAGLYGLDVYSLHTSARQVVEFLKGADPEAAKRAEARYHWRVHERAYEWAACTHKLQVPITVQHSDAHARLLPPRAPKQL